MRRSERTEDLIQLDLESKNLMAELKQQSNDLMSQRGSHLLDFLLGLLLNNKINSFTGALCSPACSLWDFSDLAIVHRHPETNWMCSKKMVALKYADFLDFLHLG